MSQQIQAIYEQGVIRPLEPVELAEGEQIEIILVNRHIGQKRGAAQILAEIAGLPIEGETDAFSGVNHDEILYPKN